jgi:hypothetical protein
MRPSTCRCISTSIRSASTLGTPPEFVKRTEKPATLSTLSAPPTIDAINGFVMSDPTKPIERVAFLRNPCASAFGV